jgi:hypothetical protein
MKAFKYLTYSTQKRESISKRLARKSGWFYDGSLMKKQKFSSLSQFKSAYLQTLLEFSPFKGNLRSCTTKY